MHIEESVRTDVFIRSGVVELVTLTGPMPYLCGGVQNAGEYRCVGINLGKNFIVASLGRSSERIHHTFSHSD